LSIMPKEEFPQEVWDKYVKPTSDLATNFQNIFKCIYIEKELKQRERGNINPERLLYGLTMDGIISLLRRTNPNFSEDELSIIIDSAFDLGITVPVFVKREDGKWIRGYRFAESVFGVDEIKHMIMISLERLCNKYQKYEVVPRKNEGIPRILFEKFFVILYESFLKNQLKFTLNNIRFKKSFNQFGAMLRVEERGREYDFLDWCNIKSITNQERGYITFNKKFYEINRESSLSNDVIYDLRLFVDIFVDLYCRVEDWKHQYRILLALSTCNTVSDYHEAIKSELVLWMGHQKYNFNYALDALSDIADNLIQKSDVPSDIVERARLQLDYIDHYFAMSELKQRVRNQIADIQQGMRALYANGEIAKHIFEKFIDKLIDSSPEPRYEYVTERLIHLIKIARCITSICRTFLWQYGLVHENIPKQFIPLKDLVKKCDELLESANKLLLVLDARISESIYEGNQDVGHRLKKLVSDLRKIYTEIERNYNTFIEKVQPEFIEITSPIIIFSYDWKKSTLKFRIAQKEYRDQVAWRLYEHLKKYSKLVGDGELRPTYDDENQALFKNPEKAARCVFYVIQEMEKYGVHIRSSLISNLYIGPPWGKVKKDIRTGEYAGALFEISARLRDYLKRINKERIDDSHIIVTEDIKNVFEKLLKSTPISGLTTEDLGIVDLKEILPDAPLLHVYVLRYKSSASIETPLT